VTGDDFGLSSDVNAAILRAHREGILTSASLMVNEPGFEEAVALARGAPSLSVGLHLAVSSSRSTLPPTDIPALVDAQGRFRRSPARAGWAYFASRSARLQLEREVRAQLEKFAATGLPIDHLDGHQHLHMHPSIFPIVLRLRAEYGIPAVRVVRDSLALNLRLDRSRAVAKAAASLTFALLAGSCLRSIGELPVGQADRVLGYLQDGRLVKEHLIGLLERLPEGVTEIYCHPSLRGGEEPGRRPREEFEALVDPAVRRAVEEAGIRCTSYRYL
jgi:hopanoid biosynthesis associated protein HpnK